MVYLVTFLRALSEFPTAVVVVFWVYRPLLLKAVVSVDLLASLSPELRVSVLCCRGVGWDRWWCDISQYG